jgi:hypothetical protein
MAADILMMQGERIPVGADQKQHVEVARDIAQAFNAAYGKTFVLPEPEIQAGGVMLPGTDGRKMSKSYGNVIEIFCDKETLKRKIMSFKTDSSPVDQAKDVSQNSLFLFYSAFVEEKDRPALKKRVESPGLEYSEVKTGLAELIWNYFAPYRKRREELAAEPARVVKILEDGADKARALELFARLRGAMPAERREISGPGGGAIPVEGAVTFYLPQPTRLALVDGDERAIMPHMSRMADDRKSSARSASSENRGLTS